MRCYFDINNIEDSLLKKEIKPNQISKTSQYIEDLARSLGVGSIVEPTPFKIQQLAEAYLLREVAKNKSMMNTGGNAEGVDSYELKRRIFADEVDSLVAQITADTFTAGKSAKKNTFPMSMPFKRG